MKVIIDGKEIDEGVICKYCDTYAQVTGEIKFGEWVQDGSGGEYGGTPCYGYYVHVIDIKPLSWSDDTKEEVEEWYPDYLKNMSLLDVLRERHVTDLELINN
jgi:hypothetical protein